MRQPLPAPLGRAGEPVPAALRPGRIGLLPARRHGDGAVLASGVPCLSPTVFSGAITVGGELARLLQHRVDHVLGQVAVEPVLERALASPAECLSVKAMSATGAR